MRIALVTDTYEPAVNGVARFTSSLAHELASNRHAVGVLAPAYPGFIISPSCSLITEERVPSVRVPFYPSARACMGEQVSVQVREFLERFQPDVVHLQTHFALAKQALKWSQHLGIPVIGTCHSTSETIMLNLPLARRINPVVHRLYWRYAISVYSTMNLMTTPTAIIAEGLRKMNISTAVKVIPNGIDTSLFSNVPIPVDEEIRTRFQIPFGNCLLFAGRIDRDKGISELIKLLELLAEREDGHLIVCGPGTQTNRLRRAVQARGLTDRVTLTGLLTPTQLSSVYRLATAMVVLNRHEVQPIAMLEAFGSGLPVVALRSPNLAEIIVHGENGFLAETTPEIHQWVQSLFHDPVLRARLSAGARQRAESCFSLPAVAQQYLASYQEIQVESEREVAMVGTAKLAPLSNSGRVRGLYLR